MSSVLDAVRRWLTHPRLPLVLALAGMALVLPVVGTGWHFDDYIHRALLTHVLPQRANDTSFFGLFAFSTGDSLFIQAMREVGVAPWWAFDGVRLAFFRPLTELTHWLDYQLWPGSPALMHLHSILWYGAAIWAATVLCRRLMGGGWAAGLAAFIYAVDKDHGLPVAWIANRSAVLCTFFGILTLVLHDRWRRDGWRRGALWAPACYLVGLLGGETTLAAGAFLFAHTLFLERGSLLARARAFLPYVAITGVWLMFYRAMGFGPHGMGAYLNPGEEPLRFLRELVERGPMFLFARFFQVSVSFYENGIIALGPFGNLCLWAAAVVCLSVLSFVLLPLFRRDAVVRFWTVGMLLGLVPACATFTTDRLLILPGIGAAGIIGAFLASWLERADWLPARRSWSIPAAAVGWLFVLLHLVVAPLALPFGSLSIAKFHQDYVAKPALTLPYPTNAVVKTVVLINPPVAFWSMYYPLVLYAAGCPAPPAMHTLASGMFPLVLTRVDARTLDIACEGGFIQSPYDQMFRGPSVPMRVGERVALRGMTAEVRAVAGWQPSHARFTFPVPLDDPSLLLLHWVRGRFVPYTPPVIGGSEKMQVPLWERIVN